MTGFPLYDEVHDSVLPTAVHAFLATHPQPLVFTPGSANKYGKAFFAKAAIVCQEMNRPGIFLTHYPEQLPQTLPPHLIHFSYVPLGLLLPHYAALIHHEGIGSCAQALRAGIPQLIQPFGFDQFNNGARVTQLEVGTTLSQRQFRNKQIVACLDHLLSSSTIRTACNSIKSKVRRSTSLTNACITIEKHFNIEPI